MEAGRRWKIVREEEEIFLDLGHDRHISMIDNNFMKERTALDFWKWLAFLLSKVNGFIKYFKCDSVKIVSAWRPLRQGWKNLDQQRRVTFFSKRDVDSSSKSSDEDPAASSGKNAARQSKSWMKRLIIRVNGKGARKRGSESFEGEARRARLARKRRRILARAPGGVSVEKLLPQIPHFGQRISHSGQRIEAGLRALLRPEERYFVDSGLDCQGKRRSSLGCRKSTPREYEAFVFEHYDEDENCEKRELCVSRYCAQNYLCRRGKASTPDTTVIQLLPDELVDRVLGWLPLTSVLRFRSVCRKWQTSLSSENFSRTFENQSSPPPAWTACPALFTSGNGRRQCAFYDVCLQKWCKICLDFLPQQACHLLTASGGLLCLCYSGMNSSLFICNPLTKSYRMLPSFKQSRRRAGSMIVHMLVHPNSKAYKVIVIAHPSTLSSTSTEVFDSETGLWTSLATVPSDGCTLAPSVVLRNGILYCLTELPTGLLAFNLARKVWRRLEIKSHFRVVFIFEHLGSILLVARMTARITSLGIWKLRESFPRVWLKVAIMPADHATYFVKSGKFQCFGHGNFICFASPRRPQWLLFDLMTRNWTWGAPARDLDQDSYNRWFFYEPRLDIPA